MKKGKILLQPMGGLANRMRVISVLYELCYKVGASFEVLWVNNSDCGAYWQQLFKDPPFSIYNINDSYIHAYRPKRWLKKLPHQIWSFFNGYTWLPDNDIDMFLGEDVVSGSAKFRTYLEKNLTNGKFFFIATGSYLGPVKELSMFTPIKEIQDKVNCFWHKCSIANSMIYGLHIRRTDNIWSITDSPLSLFEIKISNILEINPQASFYLASDDLETISLLSDKFGESLIVRDKEISRKTSSGMQEALIDMLILSKCKKIFGSYFSSFSEMASWLGGVNLEIVKR